MDKLSFALNPASNLKTFQAAVRVELAFNALRCVSGSGNRADKCRHILSSIGDRIFHEVILHIGEKEQWCAEWHSVMKMHKKDKDNNPKRFETKQWLIKKILSTFSKSILITRICIISVIRFSCVEVGLGAKLHDRLLRFISRWVPDTQVEASEELWYKAEWKALPSPNSGFCHACRSRAYQFFQRPPCSLLGRNPHSHILYRLGGVHAGAKLDTRGHRSATNFALGPFHKYSLQ